MSAQDRDFTGHDRLTVEVDGERIEVFNHVSVTQAHYVDSFAGCESHVLGIAKGDMGTGPTPDAVTKQVADLLFDTFQIDVTDRDIQVIDPNDPEVSVL